MFDMMMRDPETKGLFAEIHEPEKPDPHLSTVVSVHLREKFR